MFVTSHYKLILFAKFRTLEVKYVIILWYVKAFSNAVTQKDNNINQKTLNLFLYILQTRALELLSYDGLNILSMTCHFIH